MPPPRQPIFSSTPRATVRRRRLAAAAALLALVIAAALVIAGSGGHGRLVPGGGARSGEYDPLAYRADREQDLAHRAATGFADVLYEKSPGGVVATARRMAAFRPQVERAARATGTNPDLLAALAFLESAGRPDVVAGGDLRSATGLTQILASTAVDLLHMHVDLPRSRALTKRIAAARASGKTRVVRSLEQARRRADERFDPARSLEAAGRYLALARKLFGRDDLALASYHMGIGNLQTVLRRYAGAGTGDPIAKVVSDGKLTYPRVYFDTTPFRHPSAYALLSTFGDDSQTYLWRVLAAADIMRLSRDRPAELARLEALQRSGGSAARRLHADGGATAGGGGSPPSYGQRVGLRFAPSTQGAFAPRAEALATLVYIAAGTKAISRQVPLTVAGARAFRLEIDRQYRSRGQALAFEFMLNRLQAWNLIAWHRAGPLMEIVVSGEASRLLPSADRLAGDTPR
jgi:soluble lytic murein transglycosylase-like protein